MPCHTIQDMIYPPSQIVKQLLTRTIIQRIRDREDASLSSILRESVPWFYEEVVREYTPAVGAVTYNGVSVTKKRLLDGVLPDFVTKYVPTSSDPTYEAELLSTLRQSVTAGTISSGAESASRRSWPPRNPDRRAL